MKDFCETEGNKSSEDYLEVLKAIAMPETRSDLIGVMITPSVKAEIEAIAKQEERSVSWVGSVLLDRGLELYRKDGILKRKKKGRAAGSDND
jgi:hypothetical protein